MTQNSSIRATRPTQPLRFTSAALPAPEWTPQHEQAWQRLCAQNPRLHDGPIWAVTHADQTSLTAHISSYKRLAIQADPQVGDLGVRQLGVKGLTIATDRNGAPRLLLARRGPRVRTYPRMWETAPAGGVTPPPPGELSAATIAEALAAESREELGVDPGTQLNVSDPLAILHDDEARSVDLLLRLSWAGPQPEQWSLPRSRESVWEYAESRWVTEADAARFLTGPEAAELTPPTRWILANLPQLLRG